MKNSLELFQKFIAFLNEVSVEAEGIADEAKKDETNSGEVSLKYYLDDEHYFEIDAEGFVRDENGEKIAEGEYKLADGNVFVVSNDGKFVETREASEVESDNTEEAPIAEGFKEEKEEEDDKEKDDEPSGEDEPKGGDNSDEDDTKDSEKTDENPGEEDDKKDELEEEPAEEEPKEEAPMVNAFPYEIDGVEYLLPAEVINYIESLKTSKIEVEEKLTKLEEQTPSAMPIGTVVKGQETEDSISSRIERLSMFKGFRNRN